MTLKETLSLIRSDDLHVLFLGPACLDRDKALDEAFRIATESVAARVEASAWWMTWTPLLVDERPRRPYAADEVERLAREGVKNLVVYTFGHVSDRLETLYPVDIGLGRIAREHGMRTFRVPSLNDREELLDALASCVAQSAAGGTA